MLLFLGERPSLLAASTLAIGPSLDTGGNISPCAISAANLY
jgi:hypothetical protein